MQELARISIITRMQSSKHYDNEAIVRWNAGANELDAIRTHAF